MSRATADSSLDSVRETVDLKTMPFVVLRYGTLLMLLGTVLLPFLYALSVSVRPPSNFFAEGIYWFPKEPTLNSWVTAFEFLREPLVNTVLIATGTMVIALVVSVPSAYVFGRKQFPGKRLVFRFIIVTLLFPYVLLVIPISDLWLDLNLYNTIPGLWISFQVFIVPFAIWILRDFFADLPQDIEAAAQVYGCTQLEAFYRVILPLSAPALIAVGFLAFLIGWNDFLFSNFLTTGTGPRPAVVQMYVTTVGSTERVYWGQLMAQMFVIGTPPSVLYMISRRYLSNAFVVD